MEYGILRVNKIKLNGISKAFQQHHQREASFYKSNPDIDISKIGEDVSLIHSNNFKKDIQMQLAMYHITKTPRKDAIGLIDGVITASPKFFEGKNKQAIIGFFKRAIPLIKNEFGPIISMTIHFDEKSPHAHFACVPITGDEENGYTLSAKKVLGGQQDYIERQDRFHREYFSKYGLARGDSKQDTNREHIEQNRYKANQAKQELLKAQKDTQTQKAISQDLMIETSEAFEQLHELHNEIDRVKSKRRELQAQIGDLKGIQDQIQQQLVDMANKSDLYNDLLQDKILSGDYSFLEETQQQINDAKEAQELLDYINNSYEEYLRSEYQYDDLER